MEILYTGFKGKNNASYQLVELINPNDKVLLTNSFEGLKKDLDNISLESYNLIIMFGINKNLKDKVIIEVNSKYNEVSLATKIDYEELKLWIRNNDIDVDLNFKPTKYLCNYAYHTTLLRNSNSIFIHIPGLSKITDLNKLVSVFKKREILNLIKEKKLFSY